MAERQQERKEKQCPQIVLLRASAPERLSAAGAHGVEVIGVGDSVFAH